MSTLDRGAEAGDNVSSPSITAQDHIPARQAWCYRSYQLVT